LKQSLAHSWKLKSFLVLLLQSDLLGIVAGDVTGSTAMPRLHD